jgi:hypothetical protein
MRAIHSFERGFIGGAVTAALAIGVTLFTVGTVRRIRERRVTGTPIGIDSVLPKEVELAAQPAPEVNASPDSVPRLESEIEIDDYIVASERW